MTGWQPISTAPRDGRRVLLFCAAMQHVTIGSWQCNPYEDHRMAWSTDEGESVLLTHDAPSHWMPLPEPPSTAQRLATALETGNPAEAPKR